MITSRPTSAKSKSKSALRSTSWLEILEIVREMQTCAKYAEDQVELREVCTTRELAYEVLEYAQKLLKATDDFRLNCQCWKSRVEFCLTCEADNDLDLPCERAPRNKAVRQVAVKTHLRPVR